MSKHQAILDDFGKNIKEVSKDISPVMQGMFSLAQAASQDGVLDSKTKELIALSIAVATKCDGCIAQHAKALAARGATRQEIHEALGVAIAMGGGPSSVYAARASEAFQEFSQ